MDTNNILVDEHRRIKKSVIKRSDAIVSFVMEGANHCGNIEIDSDVFNPNDVHTGFSTFFQSYEYNVVTTSLIIKGSSPKMGGEYEVEITLR